MDTPETKHPQKPVEYFGREATAFTKKMVEGKRVRLEFDQANTHIGHKNRYKRTLAYVFLEDGTFSMQRSSSRATDTPIPVFRSSTWMSLGALSERRENREEGFTGFLLIGLDLHRGRD